MKFHQGEQVGSSSSWSSFDRTWEWVSEGKKNRSPPTCGEKRQKKGHMIPYRETQTQGFKPPKHKVSSQNLVSGGKKRLGRLVLDPKDGNRGICHPPKPSPIHATKHSHTRFANGAP